MKILVFLHGTLIMHKNGEGKTREERVRQVLDKDLSNAEEKLRQVQREINRIKNQGKIKEDEKRVAQDQSDLDNLRKGL